MLKNLGGITVKKELEKQLCEKYPEIVQAKFMFECGDGWFNIIDALCAEIKNHINNNRERIETIERNKIHRKMAADGDWSFLNDLYGELTPEWLAKNDNLENTKNQFLGELPEWIKSTEEIPEVVATQVKEKYGTLRFYYDGGDDFIHGAVAMAEGMSSRTCEVCGSPGKLFGGGWVSTLCETHAGKKS